jgi:hypothetical protein
VDVEQRILPGCGTVVGGEAKESELRVSPSDPESRVMKQPGGGFAPSYNVQINTDAKSGCGGGGGGRCKRVMTSSN